MKDERVKIVVLGPFPPTIGGIATHVQHLLASPLKDRYRFLLVRTMSRKHGTPEYGTESIPSKIWRVIGDLVRFISILLRESPLLVHINTSLNRGAFWRDSLYLFVARMFGKKVFFQIHGGQLDTFWRDSCFGAKLLTQRILGMPDRIGVLSRAQKKPFTQIGFDGKVRVFPNMIDLNGCGRTHRDRVALGVPKDRIVVLFVASHFTREKGVMELLRAASIVEKIHRDVFFVCIGGGALEGEMRAFCRRHRMEERVLFPGFLSHDSILQYLNASDMFVLPSYSEGFPFVILEAMSAGLPVVATPVGAIPEIVEDGRNGFLVGLRDAAALAEKIVFLAEDGALRKRMGRENLKKVGERYNSRVVAKLFEQNYDEILDAEARAGRL